MDRRFDRTEYLPVSQQDMRERGWWWYDFLLVTGDAYVDHPSFGAAIIGRLLEAEGYRVAVLAQPDWHSAEAFRAMGRPKLGVLVGAGNLDSMVAHYTAGKKRRSEDFYSPGRRAGLRPDRASIVYCNRAREAFPGVPVILGGLEASLRRMAHYDYWDDAVRRSILPDSGADILVYGMGERATREIAARLKKKQPVGSITDVRGTAVLTGSPADCAYPCLELPSFEQVSADARAYAEATRAQYAEHDAVRGRALAQAHGGRWVLVNPPQPPLDGPELDAVAEYPYTRWYHPDYEPLGGVPAIGEVRFSVTHNRGCFGGCSFCALALHQGRTVTARTADSVVREVEAFTRESDFKGYVSDVGGPTANFRHPSCKKQLRHGVCPDRSCLAPEPCPNLDADHGDYLRLLRRLRAIPGVKKVFVRSGVRYDYLLCDRDGSFFRELVRYHVSGQLRVAPEHCAAGVLDCMGKPHIEVYERFLERYRALSARSGLEQFAVPYLMSSHPGCTLDDAIALACWLNRRKRMPEQVQDFYPTPGTISTCMYHTGLDPRTMKRVYVARSEEEKRMQRALLQWRRPENRAAVLAALKKAGREDLIGFGPDCLLRPAAPKKKPAPAGRDDLGAPKKKPSCQSGWARPRPKKNARKTEGRGLPLPPRRERSRGHTRSRKSMKYLIAYLVLINLALFLVMGADKAAARRGARRTPERTLFGLAVVGGSLGGVLGMLAFRHKTRKPLFALGFPLLLALHAFLLRRFAG